MSTTAILVHDCGNPLAATDQFYVRMAQTLEDVIECQRLRYLVFNCELGEGFDSSARSGLDCDRFDFICDHLMVLDAATGNWPEPTGCRPGIAPRETSATTVNN